MVGSFDNEWRCLSSKLYLVELSLKVESVLRTRWSVEMSLASRKRSCADGPTRVPRPLEGTALAWREGASKTGKTIKTGRARLAAWASRSLV